MLVDVNTFIGGYPFRYVPHPDPDVLVRVLTREKVDRAWVGHLPSAFYRDPTPGNDALYIALAPHADILTPIPVVRPDWPKWERAVVDAVDHAVPGIRAYPPQWGLGPHDANMLALARACGEMGLVLLLTTRFEDMRQRHWMDTAGDLTGAAIRALARSSPRVHLLITSAGRALIEEVHWGLTPDERSRVWWDISWLWGPPEDEFAHLLRTIGADRFVYGSGWPLRLTQTPRANLDLLPEDLGDVRLIGASEIAVAARKNGL